MPDSRRSKSKLTSYGVEAAPSSPTPKTNPDTGNNQPQARAGRGGEGVPLAGAGSSWTSAKDNHLRPRGLLSASLHQLLAFMGHVD